MSGRFQGWASILSQIFPQVGYVLCASHTLNLAPSHLYNMPVIRNFTKRKYTDLIVFLSVTVYGFQNTDNERT